MRKDDYDRFDLDKPNFNIVAENIVNILGAEPKGKAAEKYVDFLEKTFGVKAEKVVVKKAKNFAKNGKFEDAAIYYRAAKRIKPDSIDAIYGYARVCREVYNENKKLRDYEQEAINHFELLNEIFPRFAESYYFLGYLYLNKGQYIKTEEPWKRFIKISKNGRDRREIRKRLKQIEPLAEIERGCDAVSSGDYESGIDILKPHLGGKYDDWFPLHYFLGVAYKNVSEKQKAKTEFETALKLNPKHKESKSELDKLQV
jgi:tetratricopeptide (TPR) repeat protein